MKKHNRDHRRMIAMLHLLRRLRDPMYWLGLNLADGMSYKDLDVRSRALVDEIATLNQRVPEEMKAWVYMNL